MPVMASCSNQANRHTLRLAVRPAFDCAAHRLPSPGVNSSTIKSWPYTSGMSY